LNISRANSLDGLIPSYKTINALTGIKYTDVKARAGWTKEVSLYELKKGVFIADTPGLFDIDESVSQKASDFVENNSDIILFFLNAAVVGSFRVLIFVVEVQFATHQGLFRTLKLHFIHGF